MTGFLYVEKTCLTPSTARWLPINQRLQLKPVTLFALSPQKVPSSRHVSPQLFSTTFVEEMSEEPLHGPVLSAEPCHLGKKPDCLDETPVVIKPVATEATGGQPVKSKHTEVKHFLTR